MNIKQIKVMVKAIWRILTLNNFILIEAKRKNGGLYSRIACRTDFEDEDDIKVLQHQLNKLKK